MKDWIKYTLFGVVSAILIGFIVFTQVRYNKLQKELNEEKHKNLERIDYLENQNKEYQKNIEKYQSDIIDLESAIDSLNKVKQKVIVKKEEVIISKDVSSAANLLKDNLQKWEN